MEQILRSILEELDHGRPAALASVAASTGSTPRKMGAVMAVGERGLLAGTVGGGALEYDALQAALTAEAPVLEYALNNADAAGLGMICGGTAEILFNRVTDRQVIEAALEALSALEPVALLLPMDGGTPALWKGREVPLEAAQIDLEGRRWLALPLSAPGRVFIFGGGHVALELTKVLDLLGWAYLVIDDREAFANTERFPRAKGLFAVEYTALDSLLTGAMRPNVRDQLCIMTRGHLADADAVRFALRTDAGYIGIMGSRKKRDNLFAALKAEGFRDVETRLTTPIGLNIGGQTPAEIAISIAAQLVEHRNRDHKK